MAHRRPRQIKRAYMTMKNPMVLFGFGIEQPDGTIKFVEAKYVEDLEEKRRKKHAKRCGTCKHFIGGGDWNLFCDLPYPDYPCGFLCHEDTVACKDYEEGRDDYEEGKCEWHYDGSRFA